MNGRIRLPGSATFLRGCAASLGVWGVAEAASRCESASFEPWNADWDGRAPPNDGKRRAYGRTRHLLLVRHGQYKRDGTLTDLGRKQASAVGKRLREITEGKRVVAMHNSDVTRAMETADLIAPHLPDVPRTAADRLLAEGCPVLPDPTHPTWRPNPEACDKDGARIELGFRKYVQRDLDGKSPEVVLADDAEPELLEPSYEVVVCHGNVIRYFVMRALQLNPRAWLRTSHANCGITHLVVKRDGGVALMGFGDSGFHPPANVTFN